MVWSVGLEPTRVMFKTVPLPRSMLQLRELFQFAHDHIIIIKLISVKINYLLGGDEFLFRKLVESSTRHRPYIERQTKLV